MFSQDFPKGGIHKLRLQEEGGRLQTHSASQNDCLNLRFVKDIYVDGGKVARNGSKTPI